MRWIFLLLCFFGFSFVTHVGCQTTPPQENNSSETPKDAQESTIEPEAQTAETTADALTEPTKELLQEPAQESASPEDAATTEPTSEANPPEPSPEPTENTNPEPSPEPTENTNPEPSPENEATQEATQEAPIDGGNEMLNEHTSEPTPETSAEITPEYPSTTLVEGSIRSFSTGAFVQGIDVCVDGIPTSCVTSGSSGEFKITDFPVGKDAILTLTSATLGLYPILLPFRIPPGQSVRPFFVGVVTATELNQLSLALSGKPLDPAKGVLVSDVFDGVYGNIPVPFAGVTVSMSPASGDGPYYPNNPPITSSTSTSNAGLAVYFNASPGSFALSYTHLTKTCKAPPIYQQDANGASTGILRAGWISLVAAFCN
ncbi:hypothetical protein L6R29_21985 [Myxococcota bacterium]|nr:hypothetical protein [Myxococcota bacterium]